jgi:hypothetical protein
VLAPLPPRGEREGRCPCPPRAEGLRKRGRDPHEAAQHAARLAEIQAGVEVPDEGEDVALAVAQRVPPAATVMVDDDDLALAAAVFEAAAATLSTVQLPNRRQLLQQYYLLDVFRARLNYPDLSRKVEALAQLHGAGVVLIEDKASGTQLLQDLQFRLLGIKAYRPKPAESQQNA